MEQSEAPTVKAEQQPKMKNEEANDLSEPNLEKNHRISLAEAQKRINPLKCTLARQLGIMTMVGECNARLEKYDLVKTLAREIAETVRSSKILGVKDILKEAEICENEKVFLQALILYQSACKLYLSETFPYEALFGIGDCMNKADDLYGYAYEANVSWIKVFCRLNIAFMDEISKDITGLVDTLDDLRVRVKVRCLGNKADCLGCLGQTEEALSVYGVCIREMREQFGENASTLRYLGEFLSNIGHLYAKKKELAIAQSYFEEAISANTMAQDYDSEAQKQEAIQRCQDILFSIELATTAV